MTRETKVGFMMVALLIGVFGFLGYKQYNRQCDGLTDQDAGDSKPAFSNDVIPKQDDGFSSDSTRESNDPFVEEKPIRKKVKLPTVIASDDSDFQQFRERKTERSTSFRNSNVESADDSFDAPSERRNPHREIQQVAATSESDPFASDPSEPASRNEEPTFTETPRRVRPLSVPANLDDQFVANDRSSDSDGFDRSNSAGNQHRQESDPFSTGRDEPSERREMRSANRSNTSANEFESNLEPAPRPARRSAPARIDLPDFPQESTSQVPGSFSDDNYVIQPSDSYWSISRKRYGSGRYFMALFRHNEQIISDAKRMKPGVTISTPAPEVLERRYADLISGLISNQSNEGSSIMTTAHSRNSEDSAPSGFFTSDDGAPMYRVADRDTLSEIAKAHLGRTSRWIQILEMNRNVLRDGNDLKIGTVLRLPADASRVQVVGTARQFR